MVSAGAYTCRRSPLRSQLAADETYTLQSTYYFRHEMQLLLEKAGFSDITVQGDYREETATADHGMLVYLARK